MEKLWELKKVNKTYQLTDPLGGAIRLEALKDIDLRLYQGETLGLVGESGSGKSTLGKVLLRLLPLSSGRIFFRTLEITHLPESRLRGLRKNFQIVFQDPYRSLNPRMKAGQIIMEAAAGSFSEKKERARKLLLDVGLSTDDFDRLPHQFSGGQRQRLAIARALGPEPEFLVCDEPTSNLDLSVQAQILNLFLQLKEQYFLTYLFISHNLKVVEFLADRIAVMFRGRIVEIGKSSQIIRSPAHPYTMSLVASSQYRVTRLALRTIPSQGCPYACFCPEFENCCLDYIPALKEIEPGHEVACLIRGK